MGFHIILIMLMMSGLNGVFGDNTEQECGAEIQKVTPCLSYATGKANTPAPDCCSSVKTMKDSDPKCLCFIMQQAHNGNGQIKNLGIQEAKLLQLPSACQLQNASVSFCPKLLGLSPSSPDAAIFTNTTATTPAANNVTTPAALEKSGGGSSNQGKQRPYFTSLMAAAMAIFYLHIH